MQSITANLINLKNLLNNHFNISFDRETEYWDFISENFDYMDLS